MTFFLLLRFIARPVEEGLDVGQWLAGPRGGRLDSYIRLSSSTALEDVSDGEQSPSDLGGESAIDRLATRKQQPADRCERLR